METYKAIIQLTSDDENVYKSIIGQIINLKKALTDNVLIEVVCHGRSSAFCLNTNNSYREAIAQLMEEGVDIKVCENMLHANHISAQQLIPGMQTVPAGIAELVIRQHEGWSYVKAGF
ncbi:DsrE family protein [Hydrotalea sp.]|uniref:DsrE family protein n=1 Tax=Hydrotalea sp. TaxID=2881279 RepID=UPI0026390787|nr:DsrE family protein [Hydrotalea sp.]